MILQTDSIDGFIDSVYEAAIRANVGRLSTEDGTLVATVALDVADALDGSDHPSDRAGAADLRSIAVGLARSMKSRTEGTAHKTAGRRKSLTPAQLAAAEQEREHKRHVTEFEKDSWARQAFERSPSLDEVRAQRHDIARREAIERGEAVEERT